MTDLSFFIASTVDSIVDEWEVFARSTGPSAMHLSPVELRDHAKVVLLAVAADMQQQQDDGERHRKSLGENDEVALSDVQRTSREHARARFDQGFSLKEMVSEYRALRASVIRRWTSQTQGIAAEQLDEITRFGEAIDEGLTESIDWYSKRLEGSRNLLIGVLAHDLRTPLSAVVMSAQYLLRSERLAHEELRAASRINSSAMRMANYIKDLLDFAQTLLGDGLHVAVAQMNLRSLCEEVADEQGAANPGAHVQVHARDDVMGQWDAQRLAQLLGNLVANAIAHGDLAHPVTLGLSQSEDTATVSVHNRGTPIDPQLLPTLFQPLLQQTQLTGDRRTGSSGMGLGLYIARLISDAHGGSIDITSEADAGTTVTLRLPKRPGEQKTGSRARVQPLP